MKKRYSHFIHSLLLIIDILIINTVIYIVSDKEYLNASFLTYINVFWIITSFLSNFYKVYRFTKIYRIFSLLFVQFSLFVLVYFSYFGIFKEGIVVHNQFLILTSILGGITLFKLLSFYALKRYRIEGKNYRNVIILGLDDTSEKITNLFKDKTDLGYRFFGFFSDKENTHQKYLGKLQQSFNYILENEIDEIYCTLSTLNKEQVKEFTKFATKHAKIIKLIPNSTELYNKNFDLEYYDTVPVLKIKKLPFEREETRIIKRVFDIHFSIFIIIFVLSWLTPLLWVLIKLESKGPIFFKQQRKGLGGQKFACYKFRSMKVNKLSDKIDTAKNDKRITFIGAFIRKTSIDELPQFFNVLKGEMSVVGPRPHMNIQSLRFEKEIDNYLVRHAVKPGITGLAQTRGYRGEIIKKSDIENRVRLDIFYIENWSFLLDIKIIIQTIFNVFRTDEKAY